MRLLNDQHRHWLIRPRQGVVGEFALLSSKALTPSPSCCRLYCALERFVSCSAVCSYGFHLMSRRLGGPSARRKGPYVDSFTEPQHKYDPYDVIRADNAAANEKSKKEREAKGSPAFPPPSK